ncbi:uncharacterized protein LOC119551746 [Drosophila subpulchrella]|uniref:uncharacterized protein LOC119551746 n=1 Tax=Drosophila subpulchrella TaxID=1486046 RepID=UPI0018A140A0|nr:uncharacterized protein LOC119551746 [Drosophila subpulchrella]
MLDLDDFKTVTPDDLTAALGFQIYKELSKEEQDAVFKPIYDEDLQVFYLMKNDKAYVPALHTKEINFEALNALEEKLKEHKIFLAIVDNTINILYYQISEGLSDKPVNSKNSI